MPSLKVTLIVVVAVVAAAVAIHLFGGEPDVVAARAARPALTD